MSKNTDSAARQSEFDRMASELKSVAKEPDEILHALALGKSVLSKYFQYVEEQKALRRVIARLVPKDQLLYEQMQTLQKRSQGT